MRSVLLASAFVISVAATSAVPDRLEPATPLDQPAYANPAQAWKSIDDAGPSPEECRTRIQHVRDQTGKPKLDRAPASPDRPLLIYAVDQKIDDCSVIVPISDPSDFKQAPEPGPPQLLPAVPGR